MNKFQKIIHRVADDSYVITKNGMPYHVPNIDGWREKWNEIDTYAKEHPEVVIEEYPYTPTLEEVRTSSLLYIDTVASSSILAGFDYEIDSGEVVEVLHFSYQYEDQQNFSDTFNGIAMKRLMGVEELPDTIGWNGWRNHTKDHKGDLVRLDLDIDSFLALYTRGALTHKAYHMAIHGERKKEIEAAETVEDIKYLLQEWGI